MCPSSAPWLCVPLDDEVADDDAAADAGAEREQDHAVGALARSGPVLPVGGGVGVVLKGGREAEVVADVLPHGDVLPRLEVRRVEDDAGGDVHRAGRRDADGGDLVEAQFGRFDGGADRLAHALKAELLAAVRLGRQTDGAEGAAGVVHDARFHARAAHVQTDVKECLIHTG